MRHKWGFQVMKKTPFEVHIEKEIEEYHCRKAEIFLEAAVGEMLERFEIHEVIERLKDYVDQMEEI